MKTINLKREPLIKQVITERNYKTIAEVGVYRGWFSKHLYETNPEKLYLIDPWQKFSKEVFSDYTDYDQKKWDDLHQMVSNKFKSKNVIIMRETSESASKKFTNASLDLVYIDANHTYDYVKMDLGFWMSKVKKGGMLCGHDYQLKSVKKAVDEFVSINNLEIQFISNEKFCATYFIKI